MPLKPFKKGQSGNPKGRPKLTPEAIEARAYAKTFTKAAIDGLVEIALNRKAPVAARVTAFIAILDRGNGKPTAPIEVEAKTEIKSVTINIPGIGAIAGPGSNAVPEERLANN